MAPQPLFLKWHHLFQDQSERNKMLEINLTHIHNGRTLIKNPIFSYC